MIEVTVGDEVVRAVDVGKNEISVRVDGWQPMDHGPDLDRPVDHRRTGSVRRIEFPEETVSIERTEPRNLTLFDPRTAPLDLQRGHYVLKIEQSVILYVAIEDPCVLQEPTEAGMIGLDFRRRSPVTLGFRSRINRPRETVTVPATLEGARMAVRYQSAGIVPQTAEKSYPSQRVHPPGIEFGETTSIPEPVDTGATLSDIRLSVPAALEDLLVIAPLSYYLRADIAFASTDHVRLTAPPLEGPLHLGTPEELAHDVAALLRRVFYLDCLVRNAALQPVEIQQTALLEELELDGAALFQCTDAERLATYLAADFDAVAGRLPDWHLSTVLDPDLASLPAIPHLLNRLSLIQCPSPVSVDRQSLLAESVKESYEPQTRNRGPCPEFDLTRNRTRLGRQQGWMTAGTPVDAFRATRSAFEARFRYYESSSGPRRVVVVINDPDMLEERDSVEAIYRDRSSELAIDVSVERSLTRAELRNVFESSVDFLHFIGHCDDAGLRCEDGWVAADAIETTTVQTFFLNACRSFEQGLGLVRCGSVAGAVTIADVLDREATRVGMTFARLIMHGFSMSRALAIASRRSVRSKFYTVVGDGTHRLSQGEVAFPAELSVRRIAADEFRLRFEFPPMKVAGGLARPRVPPDANYVLRGCEPAVDLERSVLCDFLESVQLPVVHDNEFHWSTALADRLRTDVASERPT